MFSGLKAKTQESGPLFSASASQRTKRAKAWYDSQIALVKHRGPACVEVEVTPELAELLLATNADNRNPSQVIIDRYAADMREGAWHLNGEALKIDDGGNLIDGQHRCKAGVQAGVSFRSYVIIGLPRETRTTIDIGKKRTVGDILSMSGYLDANHLGHAARVFWQYREHSLISRDPGKQPTSEQVKALLAEFPGLVASVDKTRHVARKFGLSCGLVAALHFIFAQLDPQRADTFFGCLKDGIGFSGKSDAQYRLRERLVKAKGEKARLPTAEVGALVIKAWNFVRDGRPCRGLAWRAKGDTAEPFPIAR